MTTETTTETESFGTEPEAPAESLSVEDTIREAYEEARDAAETDDAVQGSEGEAEEAPESDVTKAARTLAKARKRDNSGKFTKAGEASDEATETESAETEDDAEEPAQRLEPPQRWPVSDKEEFHKLPPVAKRQVLDFWNGIESHTTKLWQDLNRGKARYEQLDQVISHYVPKWNLKGMTDVQAVAELCATQDLFTQNPVEACDLLLRKSGVTPEQLYQYRQGGGQPAQVAAQPGPHISALTQRIDGIYNYFQQSQESQQQQAIQQAQAEVEAVRSERSADGRYLYPELHDASQLQRVQPLVEDLRKTQPGISWGEAAKRAVNAIRIIDGRYNGSPSPNGSRLSQEDLSNQRRASVSVRSRGNASIPTTAKAQPGESIEDSIRSAIAMSRS